MASIPWSQNASERQQQFAVAIQTLIGEIGRLQTTAGGSSQPKPVLPHLDKFTGDKKELDTWIYTAEAKLHVDGHAIGDLEAQFYYLYSSLSPAVRRTLFAFAQIPGNRTPARLLEKLRINYGEVNQDKKAGLELFALQQKSREPITSFLVRFEEVLYRAKANTWPDQAIINSLMSSLNDEWLGRLRERPDAPDSYSELCAYLRRLDGNNFLGGSTGHSSAAVQDKGEPMEIAVARIQPTGGSSRAGSSSGPSDAQRKRWKKKGACIACGSPSHWSKECPINQGQTRIRYIRATESDGGLEEDGEIYDDDEH
ncbi:hypothetical protein SMACR_00223 [Sordaria macrospora]|uniref:WGS project CABT00000000 data, contig 2.1 n=2 Tax=Sordaria macrospora TaxID=5147 RepID=F7VKI0_SORMK|nr:uncharacterized protein SMAC_00223 [Sordaria macrospora k-hell]KAA8636796.1 hypothetical protein SMACR_00223 [Sordaria macrospora]WPJ58967.1 hypothetical protein SMAC4_00223 [Sordaria macrospora]CCC06007.1 unnamed protein product [Sordaria macrospora k-hell]